MHHLFSTANCNNNCVAASLPIVVIGEIRYFTRAKSNKSIPSLPEARVEAVIINSEGEPAASYGSMMDNEALQANSPANNIYASTEDATSTYGSIYDEEQPPNAMKVVESPCYKISNEDPAVTKDDGCSVDSDFDPEISRMSIALTNTRNMRGSVMASLESVMYDEAQIRKEFESYQRVLPHPDKLLQEQHSVQMLRALLAEENIEPPRFLRFHDESEAINPHHALCCLLLKDYDSYTKGRGMRRTSLYRSLRCVTLEREETDTTSMTQMLSCGTLSPQLIHPAEVIKDQFYRAAPAIPLDVVKPHVLRHKIRDQGLPVPNYFLDPEDPKQFPPHIALLVILQDGEDESRKLDNVCYHIAFSVFAFIALCLRLVLEVIGGAGAIWGGAEVFALRRADNAEVWRWLSVAVGILCLLRFVTVNLPQAEDAGDILGPAGPWSLPFPSRLRAVCNHPFHYFFRAALAPVSVGSRKFD